MERSDWHSVHTWREKIRVDGEDQRRGIGGDLEPRNSNLSLITDCYNARTYRIYYTYVILLYM